MVSPVPRPLLPDKTKKPSLLCSIIDATREISISSTDHEEFDFSEVFGPLPSPQNAALLTNSAADFDSSDDWCSATDIVSSTEPAVICTRSHSFVGPSIYTPRGSKNLHIDVKNPNGLSQSLRDEVIHSCSDDSSSDGGVSDKVERESVRERKVGPQDFVLLRVVGQGAFGKVFQVQHVHTKEIFAMKVMKKEAIMEKNQGDYMRAERDILTKIVHPFIVQLRYSFQTKSKLYLILDFINGGHLFFQLYRQGTFSEDLARIYTAEIVAAVSHLHENGIIHRDLKPENILLDAEGHVKLTDFGLAKEIDESTPTNSLCGTVEYMAPEILLANGHGKAADWWSVGILLYEMLTGQPPFTHKNRQKLQDKIVKDKVKLPSYLTSEVHSLLKGLLMKEPAKRLGSGPNKSDEIKQHKWFKTINWKKLEARQIQPKFRPEVNGMDCVANFDEKWTMLPAQDSPASTPRADDSSIFKGYTYVAPNTWLTLLEDHTHERS